VPDRIFVTGASRGIGRAIAEQLSTTAQVIAAVRSEADGERLRADSNGRIDYCLLELTNRQQRTFAIQEAETRFGPIDAFVHAAGLGEHRPIADTDDAQIERLFEVNVFAGIDLARQFVRACRDRGNAGNIVFITSTLVDRPAPTTSIYSATKGALTAFTKALAIELAGEHIRVNAVAPGIIDTDMIRSRGDDLQALAKLHPVGRMGHAHEVADAVAYLLSAEFATGTVLTLDGGLSLA
jgi:3-oxoacyl-[acyl-carrier protein] reductase